MRVSLFFALSYLSTAVWAGGYQGCLERVWLFQAYEVDALYPEADRTIGFKCNKWNEATHTCNVDWTPCKGRQAGGRCSFDELMFWLGKAPSRDGWADPSTGRLNIEDTAKKCVSKFTSQPGGGRAVPNPPPQKVMKNTWEYNDYITKIGQKVNDAWKDKKTDANKYLWEDFDSTREKITVARAGDHGPFLIAGANAKLGATMTIHTQDLGINPATGEKWETVDWKETANQARASGVADAHTRIKNFLNDWYRGSNTNAKAHYQVIKSYKRVADRTASCRK